MPVRRSTTVREDDAGVVWARRSWEHSSDAPAQLVTGRHGTELGSKDNSVFNFRTAELLMDWVDAGDSWTGHGAAAVVCG